MSQLFGVVVPGRPVITEFVPLSESKAVTTLPDPQSITELTFFMLPTTPCPPGFGCILYYSIDLSNWVLVGSVSPEKQSGIFRTGWPTNEQLAGCPAVHLGVSLEPMSTISNLELVGSGMEDRFNFAHKIAVDLFQYMASFQQGNAPAGMMIVPTNVFDKWMERFERKYRLDPNFMLKQASLS